MCCLSHRLRHYGTLPAPTASRTWQRAAHSSVSSRLSQKRKSGQISRQTRRLCCPAHARTAAHDCDRGLRPRLRAKVAAEDRRLMSQTACERCRLSRSHALAPRRPRSLSAQSRRSTSRSLVDTIHATTSTPITRFQPPCAHPSRRPCSSIAPTSVAGAKINSP
jgi:hypothetical protein